jgi:hypothetical protein
MTALDLIMKAWPLALAAISLIIILSKIDLRVAVLEEKVKSIFEIMNRKSK